MHFWVPNMKWNLVCKDIVEEVELECSYFIKVLELTSVITFAELGRPLK